MGGVSLAAAFTAGLVSFLSPCVLPLVPGYISLVSGASVDDLKTDENPKVFGIASSAGKAPGAVSFSREGLVRWK